MREVGGEEFVIALPDTSVENALILAERIRASVEHTPVSTGDQLIAARPASG